VLSHQQSIEILERYTGQHCAINLLALNGFAVIRKLWTNGTYDVGNLQVIELLF
jgi:hypothetical protein